MEGEIRLEKSKIMMIVIIALLVVMLATIIVGGIFTFRLLRTGGEDVPERIQPINVTVSPSELDLINLSSAIVTNLAMGTDGTERFISMGISIGVINTDKKESPVIKDLIISREPLVKDICLAIVGRKTAQELRRPDGKEILADEILAALQQEFGSNLIYSISYSDWRIS